MIHDRNPDSSALAALLTLSAGDRFMATDDDGYASPYTVVSRKFSTLKAINDTNGAHVTFDDNDGVAVAVGGGRLRIIVRIMRRNPAKRPAARRNPSPVERNTARLAANPDAGAKAFVRAALDWAAGLDTVRDRSYLRSELKRIGASLPAGQVDRGFWLGELAGSAGAIYGDRDPAVARLLEAIGQKRGITAIYDHALNMGPRRNPAIFKMQRARGDFGKVPRAVLEALIMSSSEDLGAAYSRLDRTYDRSHELPEVARAYLRMEGLNRADVDTVISFMFPFRPLVQQPNPRPKAPAKKRAPKAKAVGRKPMQRNPAVRVGDHVRYSESGLRGAMVGSRGMEALRYFESLRGTIKSVGPDVGFCNVLWPGGSRGERVRDEQITVVRSNPEKKRAPKAKPGGRKPMQSQAILLEMATFALARAKAWLDRNGHKYGDVREGGDYWHAEQHDSSDYQKGTLHNIAIAKHVEAIVGVPKRGSDAADTKGYNTRGQHVGSAYVKAPGGSESWGNTDDVIW